MTISFAAAACAVHPARQSECHFYRPLFIVCCVLAIFCITSCSVRDDALDRIRQAGMLAVGLDPSWPPFAFIDPASGEIAGLDVDLARAVGAGLGVEVQFVVSGWEGLYGALEDGQFDAIVSVLPYDPRRTSEVAYSISYFDAGPVIVVPVGEAGIGQPRDLAGRDVHVRLGSKGHEQAQHLQNKGSRLGIITHNTAAEALAALTAAPGNGAAIVDAISARLFIRDDDRLQVVGDPLIDEPYVIAVDRQARSLQSAIDKILVEMRESGELDAILGKWL